MPLNYERIMAYRPADMSVAYGPRDCVIYALGIGIGMDPMDWGQLKFVYEKELTAFPSMGVILGRHGPLLRPEFGVDQRMMVAAALRLVLHEPLAIEAKLTARPRVREVIDKGEGSAAIIEMTRDLIAADGRVVATVDNSTLVRKHGGFGGRVKEIAPPPDVPARAPDAIIDLPTPPNLALVYRLNGDENPLHADPDRAQSVGFPRPILHGAATFGIATHAVVRHIGYRAEQLAAIEARFVRPVYPGDTLRAELWQEGGRISFQCSVVGRDGLVLTNGLARLRQ
jgi:acyl dehydratase